MPCTGLEPGTSRLRGECATNWAILPNEKLRKNNDNMYLICCSTNVCIPFNIVQHTLAHIVEHRKLDSLATSDNIVWSTVTSCWTNNVHQFDPSLPCIKDEGNFCRWECSKNQIYAILRVWLPDQNGISVEITIGNQKSRIEAEKVPILGLA